MSNEELFECILNMPAEQLDRLKAHFEAQKQYASMLRNYRPVCGYVGLYSVDEDGNVWDHMANKHVRIINLNYTGNHPRVRLVKNGYERICSVADLVAEAFVPNPNGYHIVKHKNGNQKNCKARNLVWSATA